MMFQLSTSRLALVVRGSSARRVLRAREADSAPRTPITLSTYAWRSRPSSLTQVVITGPVGSRFNAEVQSRRLASGHIWRFSTMQRNPPLGVTRRNGIP